MSHIFRECNLDSRLVDAMIAPTLEIVTTSTTSFLLTELTDFLKMLERYTKFHFICDRSSSSSRRMKYKCTDNNCSGQFCVVKDEQVDGQQYYKFGIGNNDVYIACTCIDDSNNNDGNDPPLNEDKLFLVPLSRRASCDKRSEGCRFN